MVDPIYLTILNNIVAQQTNDTQNTAKPITSLHIICANFPKISLILTVSDIVLHVNYDASYLSLSKARSRIHEHYYLSDLASNLTKKTCKNLNQITQFSL